MPPVRPRLRRLAAFALTPQGAAVAAVVLLVVILGCGLSAGSGAADSGPKPASGPWVGKDGEPDGTYCQEGEGSVGPGETREVYYPIPYASPPNLDCKFSRTGPDGVKLLAQAPTCFTVCNPSSSEQTVKWKARGIKGKVVHTVVPIAPPPVAPPPEPAPAVPVPVGPSEPPGRAR